MKSTQDFIDTSTINAGRRLEAKQMCKYAARELKLARVHLETDHERRYYEVADSEPTGAELAFEALYHYLDTL